MNLLAREPGDPVAAVHFGRAAEVLAKRQAVLDAFFAEHPERFPRGRPTVPALPEAVYINPPPTAKQPTSALAPAAASTRTHEGLIVPAGTSILAPGAIP